MADEPTPLPAEDAETERVRWKTRSRMCMASLAFCAWVIGYYTLHDKDTSMAQSNLDSAWGFAVWVLAFIVLGRSAEYVLRFWVQRGSILAGIATGQQQTIVQSGTTRVEVKTPQQGGQQ